MAFYTNYLIAYDIEDNKSRRRLFKSLKDLGLKPIQKSVFWGELNRAEFSAAIREIRECATGDLDRAFWQVSSMDQNKLRQCIGYKNFTYIGAGGYEVL